MKSFLKEFFRRGLLVSMGGPVILALIYYFTGKSGAITTLSPVEVAREILTITLLAFIAGGISAIYKIERLPLFSAILIHGLVLYCDYILIYLVNGWLQSQWQAIAIFTGAFILGFGIIWLIIYLLTKRSTRKLNENL